MWVWDLIVLFPPNPESLTTSTLTDFSVFQKNGKIRQHIIKQNIIIYNVDIYCLKRSRKFLENLVKSPRVMVHVHVQVGWIRLNYIPIIFQLQSNYIPITFQIHSNYNLITFQLHSNYNPIIPITFQILQSDYIPITTQLHSNYNPIIPITFQLQPIIPITFQ